MVELTRQDAALALQTLREEPTEFGRVYGVLPEGGERKIVFTTDFERATRLASRHRTAKTGIWRQDHLLAIVNG